MNITNVNSKILTNNITGKSIGVCVLDTGLDTNHPKLSDNFKNGYDFVNNDNNVSDDHSGSHGTHVSGIVEGVAPNIILVHNKVMNSAGSGLEDDIIEGVNWCIGNKTSYNITVISMSLGTESPNLYSSYCDSTYPTFASAINKAIANNISIVAASGNDGSTTSISSPACITNASAIGWTDKSNALASSGNRNSLIALLATGTNINSTAIGGGYTILSGTSMSTPHAAGAFALAQQFEYEENNKYAQPSTILQAFKNTGINVSAYVLVDADNAIISLDSTNPVLILAHPQATNYTQHNISINYTAKDVFLDTVRYTINNGQNNTLTANTTVSLEGGTYTFTITANDSKGNINTTTLTFGIDLPNVTLNAPSHNYNDLDGSVDFNCSISDITGIANLSLYHNQTNTWKINQTTTLTGLSNTTTFSLNLTGNHTFSWTCLGYDTNRNLDTAENRTIRYNSNSAPSISFFYPNATNVSINEPNNQTFNISYADLDGDIVTIRWYKNNALSSSTIEYNATGNYTSSGNYNITVIVNDTWSFTSKFWNFTINNTEFCGDNIKNSTETCDGADLNSQTCVTQGYLSGTLSCSSTCNAFVTSSCSNSTGSGGGDSDGGGSGDSNEEDTTETTVSETVPVEEAPSTPVLSGNEEAVFSESTATSTETGNAVQETIGPASKEKRMATTILGAIGATLIISLSYFFIRKELNFISRKGK